MTRDRGAGLEAVVRVSKQAGGRVVDSEVPVHSLEDLYEACRRLAPNDIVRLSLRGEEGEVTLDFGSFLREP
jgi:hypothetical protein